MDALPTHNGFLFGGFHLDRRGLSRRDQSGALIPLSIGSRALEILRVLVARPGEVVTKDEIMNAVWPGTIVESAISPCRSPHFAGSSIMGE